MLGIHHTNWEKLKFDGQIEKGVGGMIDPRILEVCGLLMKYVSERGGLRLIQNSPPENKKLITSDLLKKIKRREVSPKDFFEEYYLMILCDPKGKYQGEDWTILLDIIEIEEIQKVPEQYLTHQEPKIRMLAKKLMENRDEVISSLDDEFLSTK